MGLKIDNLSVSYGTVKAVRGVSFKVEDGEIVTLIGANGAGKTTILRTISGLEKAVGGTIEFNGEYIQNKPPHEIVKRGIAHVPEGRRIFENLSVEDNLNMGAHLSSDVKKKKENLAEVYRIFPRLQERAGQLGGTLSGGEQQMLAVGRALMTDTKVIFLDEPSMGLAPMIVEEIFRIITRLNAQGRTILLVEQNAYMALSIAHRAYILETGEVTSSGGARDLLSDPSVRKAYLGM